MIHYALQCDAGHAFDGWFATSTAFDAQVAAHQLECPRCASVAVSRALMAPAIARPAPPALPPLSLPAEMRAVLQKLREVVEQHCDDVGPDFAEQARRMHQGEIESRAIYGQTTEDEAEQLHDDGVPFGRLPWVPRADG